jgi:hypothetical protein
METWDDETDERTPKHELESPARPSEWRTPLQLAGLGLVLMIGGYAAMNYVPPARTPHQVEQERLHDDLREKAAQPNSVGEADPSLADRLKEIRPPWRTPPYVIPGRLALFGGLFLFVAAGVLMYRHAPKKRNEDEPTP